MTLTRLLSVLTVLAFPLAYGATLNIATGLDSGGALIATDLGCDAHWTVDGTTACSGGAAQVVMANDADWYGGWLADGPNSNWVARNASSTANGSPLPTFTLIFFVTDTTGASLSGSWAIDDDGSIALNGNTLDTQGSGGWGSLHNFSAPASDFVVGLNTLTVTMSSSDNFLEAVRVEGRLDAIGASFVGTPEPSSVLALLSGFGALAMLRRRKS